MHILEIAFQAFFHDTKKLVADGVNGDIARILAYAESPADLETARLNARRRETALKSWLALDRPLDYGHSDSTDAFRLLVNAVVADEGLISYGLPNFQEHSMAPSTLVDRLLLASKSLPSRPAAPIISNGSFLRVLPVALDAIVKLNHFSDPTTIEQTVSQNLLHAIYTFKISFVPSHKPRSSSSGAPPQAAVFNSWANIGARDPRRRLLSLQPATAPSSSTASSVALNRALAFDTRADWTIATLSLSTLCSVLHKTSLPLDFSVPKKTSFEYVDETYNFVRDNYDGAKPLHHLALIISIVATSLLPSLFMPTDVDKSLFRRATSTEAIKEVYHDIPWVSRDHRRGMIEKSIFVSMLTTFIIALYEDKSPLRLHMNQSSRQALGDQWTSKHCKAFPSLYSPFLILLFPFSCQRDVLYNPHSSWHPLGEGPRCL